MSVSSPDDLYAILGVADTASHMTVSNAYRAKMRATHPDVAGDTPQAQAQAARVNAAWAVLRDPSSRASYDRSRAARLSSATRRPAGSPFGPDAGEPPPSWSAVGPRPLSAQQLRDAASRNSAYGRIGEETRVAFGRASLRFGWIVVAVGAVLLALFLRG